jgi:hypothetical protein
MRIVCRGYAIDQSCKIFGSVVSEIIFLRTTKQNLTKLGRNDVWKDLYKQYTFRYGWLNKMTARNYLKFWLADLKKICSLKPQDQIFWNFIWLFTAMTLEKRAKTPRRVILCTSGQVDLVMLIIVISCQIFYICNGFWVIWQNLQFYPYVLF